MKKEQITQIHLPVEWLKRIKLIQRNLVWVYLCEGRTGNWEKRDICMDVTAEFIGRFPEFIEFRLLAGANGSEQYRNTTHSKYAYRFYRDRCKYIEIFLSSKVGNYLVLISLNDANWRLDAFVCCDVFNSISMLFCIEMKHRNGFSCKRLQNFCMNSKLELKLQIIKTRTNYVLFIL